MSTAHEAEADLEAVCSALAEKRPVDPEVVRRVQARSAELRMKFDEEVSVRLVREAREE